MDLNYFINIETSTDICSVSLSRNAETITLKENHERNHASAVSRYIEDILKENNLKVSDLSGVAISKGPGSYTGLRIGTSTAKGMAYQSGIKLIAVDTLQAMALKVVNKKEFIKSPETVVCATLDAGRNEVYSEVFDLNNNCLRACQAEIITPESYTEYFKDKYVVFTGNAAAKISGIIKNPKAVFATEIAPSAEYMAQLTYNQYVNNQFVDVAYFEPFYLKDFIAVISNKNVLKH